MSEAAAQLGLQQVVGPIPATYQAKLALATDTEMVDTAKAGSPRVLENRLVWTFIGHGTFKTSDSHLGALNAQGTATVPNLPDGSPCTGVWLVDATTGTYLEGYSSCPSASSSPTP